MGMVTGVQGGTSRRRRYSHQPMAEINVTPFVDVMLVLLIVFMVSAPLLTTGVPIDLPETSAKALEGNTEPMTISVRATGEIFLQDEEVGADKLVDVLRAAFQNDAEKRIYLRADSKADYETVMKVMGRLNAAGFKRIGLVTSQERS